MGSNTSENVHDIRNNIPNLQKTETMLNEYSELFTTIYVIIVYLNEPKFEENQKICSEKADKHF